MEEPFDDAVDVMLDLNPHISNLVIVGGVDFNREGKSRFARYSLSNYTHALCKQYVCQVSSTHVCL